MKEKRFLKAAIVCFVFSLIVILLWILTGCAANQTQMVCRHTALAGAFTDRDYGYPVRVCVEPGVHSQHQAFIDGKWRWRCLGTWDQFYTCQQDDFHPGACYSYSEFMDKQIRSSDQLRARGGKP